MFPRLSTEIAWFRPKLDQTRSKLATGGRVRPKFAWIRRLSGDFDRHWSDFDLARPNLSTLRRLLIDAELGRMSTEFWPAFAQFGPNLVRGWPLFCDASRLWVKFPRESQVRPAAQMFSGGPDGRVVQRWPQARIRGRWVPLPLHPQTHGACDVVAAEASVACNVRSLAAPPSVGRRGASLCLGACGVVGDRCPHRNCCAYTLRVGVD